MKTLNLVEIKKIREWSTPDGLRRCGAAFGIASTYLPALCDMAEDYLKTRAIGNIAGHRKTYTITGDSINGWFISGSDGFSVLVGKGDSSRDTCVKIAERLNNIC